MASDAQTGQAGRSARLPVGSWFMVLATLAVLFGILARVIVIGTMFGWSTAPTDFDDLQYYLIAQDIRETGQLTTHHHPVGYPLFVAATMRVDPASFTVTRIAQVLLGAVTILCVGFIALRLYNRAAAVIAMWIVALYPGLQYLTGRIMSETLFITLLFLALAAWIEWAYRPRTWLCFSAAALFALATLVRSNLLLMTAWVPLWIALNDPRGFARGVGAAIGPSILMAAIILAPGVYFQATQGEFIPLATNAGKTFYGANNEIADGGWVSVDDYPQLLRDLPQEALESETAYNSALNELGRRWIADHPAQFVRLLPRKLANAWVPGKQKAQATSQNDLFFYVNAVTFGLVVLVGLAGMFLARPDGGHDGLLPAVLVAYTIMSLIFYGNPRVGIFCVPVGAVYAAGLIVRIGVHAVERATAGPRP